MGGYHSKNRKNREEDPCSGAERMKAAALRILARRSHTRFEIFQKLQQRGYPAEAVNPLLDRFTGYGYLDDARAARSRVRYRLESRPVGRRLMGKELFEKGVSVELREAVLDEFYVDDTEQKLAFGAAQKKWKGGSDDRKARERLLRFLERRGFPMRICIEAVDRLGMNGGAPVDSSEEFEAPSWP